ncbi:MAG: hypothetical protein ACLTX6_02065 [Lachnospiraceae bacterium]
MPIFALYGMEVIDSGVAVLSMHASMGSNQQSRYLWGKKAYKAFLLDA